MSHPLLFVPLTKIDQEKRLVFGIATAEKIDRSGEVCDYASTKPLYEQWSQAIAQASDGKSLGNIRAMHRDLAVGKIIAISFDDDAKQIEICAKIIDDSEWKKVEEGVYTGFSQGGVYAKRWIDDDGVTRYTADPYEISLVDMPCLPTATFQIIKAGGQMIERTFKTGTQDPTPEELQRENDAVDAGQICLDTGMLESWSKVATIIQELESISEEISLIPSSGTQDSINRAEFADYIKSLCTILTGALTGQIARLFVDCPDDFVQAASSDGEPTQKNLRNRHSTLTKILPLPLNTFLAKARLYNNRVGEDGHIVPKIADATKTTKLDRHQHLEKALTTAVELADTTHQLIKDQLIPTLHKMSDRLEAIEAQPRPLPFTTETRPLSKAQDTSGWNVDDLDQAFSQMKSEEREMFIFKYLLNQPKKMGLAHR